MRAAELLLAFCGISVTLRAADPQDYFENLRDKAFVEFDQPYLARNKDAPPDAPPLFRARHLILRLKSYGDEERRWWPQRDLLLVEMPSGRRWVIESTSPKFDLNHLDEETPARRVSADSEVVESFYAASAGDLASWRMLTYLPQDLPPFPPLPAEGGIN
jgi:hypothetical protein